MTSTPEKYGSATGRLSWLADAVFWSALATAFVITHWPRISIPAGTDQSFHSVGYLGLGILAANRLWWRRSLTWSSALGWFLALAGWAAFDEFSQPWFGRHADLHDWYADLRGLAVGLGLCWLVASLRPQPPR